jgi:hypothetical protein
MPENVVIQDKIVLRLYIVQLSPGACIFYVCVCVCVFSHVEKLE